MVDSETRMEPVQQAALCWRQGASGPEVLLITSRETGRWVIPKGWPIKGLSGVETALREAWEEAGVTPAAPAASICLGEFCYDKVLDRGAAQERLQPCRVQVHAVEVAALDHDFPERGERARRWCPAPEAAGLVEEPGLRRLIEDFAQSHPVGPA